MLKTYNIDEIGKYGVIYCLTSPSGKCYIGQSWNVKARFNKYKNLSNNIVRQPKLYNALKKYESLMKYEIIDLCETQIEMDNKEAFYINLYNSIENGYNSNSGGKSNGKLSQNVKNNISLSKKEFFKTHHNNRKGKFHTLESKNKISETKKINFSTGITTNIFKGKTISKEILKKRLDSKIKNGKLSYYKIITPSKNIVVVRCLKKFCIDNNINYRTLIAFMNRDDINPPQNYTIKKITPEECKLLREYILHNYDYPF